MRRTLCLCLVFCFLILPACMKSAFRESDGIQNDENNLTEEITVQFEPITFEEAAAKSTQVFLGQVTEKYADGANSYVIVSAEQAFYGIDEGTSVKVLPDSRIPDLRKYLEVKEGEELLIMLQKYVSVLEEEDKYLPSYHCFIPVNRLEDACFAGGKLSSLSAFYEREQILSVCSQYAGLEGKTHYGREYVRSAQLQTIVEGSENVVCVRIRSELLSGSAPDRKTVLCEVTKSLKGGLEAGKVFSLTLRNEWGIEVGGEYILAVEFYENAEILGDYYGLTSKASFWDPDSEKEIAEWI